MHLINRATVALCIHVLQTEHDQLIKSGVKGKDAEGNDTGGPIISVKHALDDLIRYDSSIVFLQTTLQDLDGD
jgi:hypothetical protein